MEFPYDVACSPIPERLPQGFIEIAALVVLSIQDEVEGGDSGTKVPSFPVLQIVTPGSP